MAILPEVAHKQGLGLHGGLIPHHPIPLLGHHTVSPYKPHVSVDGILLIEVTPLAVHDEADVDALYVLQIHVAVGNEQHCSGVAHGASWGVGRLKGISINERLEICEAKALHLEGMPWRHEPYVPKAQALLTS